MICNYVGHEAHIQVLAETHRISVGIDYDIDSSLCTITFASKSDEHHMPVALASMIAKYTRELMMIRFNSIFH